MTIDLLREITDQVGESYSVRLPNYVNVSKTNVKAANLNVYRNLHHHHLNKQKANFKEEVLPLLAGKPRANRIWIHYEIFATQNGRLDTMNIGSIVDKYFSDVLVEAGKIPDDNYEHLILSTFSFGGVRPSDGHTIATVHILKEIKPMRVMLDQEDIQLALDNHVKTLGLPAATGVELSVTDDGEIEAEVLMGDVKPKSKGGRPKGSRNKTRKDTDDADETGDDAGEGSSDASDSAGSDEAETEAPAEPSPPAEPTEEVAAEEKTAGKAGKGNLFGDSGAEESSESQTETDSTEAPDGPSSRMIKKSKASIFDV